jgi:hypothetical protein
MSGLIEDPGGGGSKINWWAAPRGCMQQKFRIWLATDYCPQAENASPNAYYHRQ